MRISSEMFAPSPTETISHPIPPGTNSENHWHPSPTMTSANHSSPPEPPAKSSRSEEHTSELQSRPQLVCRLLLEKKKNASSLRKFGGPYSGRTFVRFSLISPLWSRSSL